MSLRGEITRAPDTGRRLAIAAVYLRHGGGLILAAGRDLGWTLRPRVTRHEIDEWEIVSLHWGYATAELLPRGIDRGNLRQVVFA